MAAYHRRVDDLTVSCDCLYTGISSGKFHVLVLDLLADICCVVFSIEANQMEDREMNKMWLVRHLEVTRQLVLEDLRVVKVVTTYQLKSNCSNLSCVLARTIQSWRVV